MGGRQGDWDDSQVEPKAYHSADLMFQANELASKSFRPLEVYTVVAIMYFFLILIFSQLTILLEYRLAKTGEGTLR